MLLDGRRSVRYTSAITDFSRRRKTQARELNEGVITGKDYLGAKRNTPLPGPDPYQVGDKRMGGREKGRKRHAIKREHSTVLGRVAAEYQRKIQCIINR